MERKPKPSLYKTELCANFIKHGVCPFGSKCQFAHGGDELRRPQRHPKYKTVQCKTFWTYGSCPYGNRCQFVHLEPVKASASEASDLASQTQINLAAQKEAASSSPSLVPSVPPAPSVDKVDGDFDSASPSAAEELPLPEKLSVSTDVWDTDNTSPQALSSSHSFGQQHSYAMDGAHLVQSVLDIIDEPKSLPVSISDTVTTQKTPPGLASSTAPPPSSSPPVEHTGGGGNNATFVVPEAPLQLDGFAGYHEMSEQQASTAHSASAPPFQAYAHAPMVVGTVPAAHPYSMPPYVPPVAQHPNNVFFMPAQQTQPHFPFTGPQRAPPASAYAIPTPPLWHGYTQMAQYPGMLPASMMSVADAFGRLALRETGIAASPTTATPFIPASADTAFIPASADIPFMPTGADGSHSFGIPPAMPPVGSVPPLPGW